MADKKVKTCSIDGLRPGKKTYEIQIVRTVTCKATVKVRANSQGEAEELADSIEQEIDLSEGSWDQEVEYAKGYPVPWSTSTVAVTTLGVDEVKPTKKGKKR